MPPSSPGTTPPNSASLQPCETVSMLEHARVDVRYAASPPTLHVESLLKQSSALETVFCSSLSHMAARVEQVDGSPSTRPVATPMQEPAFVVRSTSLEQ